MVLGVDGQVESCFTLRVWSELFQYPQGNPQWRRI